ncbi:MAG: TetR family transcriptional regulator [Myxococcales bacterium]|nr:TetR family transcriptional regulator [Myxococcales bacterium]
MRCFQRARQPAEIAQRRQAILDAAAELLQSEGIANVSLNSIARHVGLAKSNVYRYFESREKIFLDVLIADTQNWVSALERALLPLAGSNDADAVAQAITDSVVAAPRLCQLVSALGSVIEQNVSEETMVEFKTSVLGVAIRLVNAFHLALPKLPAADLIGFLRSLYALITGLWPMAHPSPVAAKVLERPEFAPLRTSFDRDMHSAIRLVIRGFLSEREPTRERPRDVVQATASEY